MDMSCSLSPSVQANKINKRSGAHKGLVTLRLEWVLLLLPCTVLLGVVLVWWFKTASQTLPSPFCLACFGLEHSLYFPLNQKQRVVSTLLPLDMHTLSWQRPKGSCSYIVFWVKKLLIKNFPIVSKSEWRVQHEHHSRLHFLTQGCGRGGAGGHHSPLYAQQKVCLISVVGSDYEWYLYLKS